MADEPQLTGDKCLRCGGPMWAYGIDQFRVGGTKGGWKLLFGEWAELNEDMVSFEIFVCGDCRRVELRLPE